ncbi:MAG: helix-turn-helix domain-containing protein [Sneathiella sp.]
MAAQLTNRLSARLKELRSDKGWSLERLAEFSGISRATLSRIENANVSPTTDILGKLCTVYAMSLTRLMASIEDDYAPLIRPHEQKIWTDKASGFSRRSLSPPAGSLAAEVIHCILEPGASLSYDAPPITGQEHHLVMQEGELLLIVEGKKYELKAGDCLRYQLFGATAFKADDVTGAKYLMVLV